MVDEVPDPPTDNRLDPLFQKMIADGRALGLLPPAPTPEMDGVPHEQLNSLLDETNNLLVDEPDERIGVRPASAVDRDIDRAYVAASRICDGIRERYDEMMESRRVVSPQVHLRASSFGHPCDRKLYHDIVDWKKKEPFGIQAHRHFDRGEVTESFAITLLNKLGYRLLAEQTTSYDEELNLSAKIEGYIVETESGIRVLAEVKSAAGRWIEFLTGLPDFRLSEYDFLLDKLRDHEFGSNYYSQVQIYLFQRGMEAAVLIIWDVVRWRPITIPIPFDFEYAHRMIERAKSVNAAIAKKKPPEYIRLDSVCMRCPHYGRACNPPIGGERTAEIITDPTLIELLEEERRIKHTAMRHQTVIGEIKDYVRRRSGIIGAGPFIIRNSVVKASRYPIPQEVKRAYKESYDQVRTTWHRVGESTESGGDA